MVTEMLDLETLLRVPYVDPDYAFGLSPDGREIAFAWNLSGQWEIYTLPLDGSSPPRQVTAGPGSKFAPRWSPNGDRLAYVLDLDGGEVFDLYLYDFAQGRHVNLTPGTPESFQPNFSWSPDGAQIALISDRSGRFDTYVMPVDGGYNQAQPVLSVPHPDWEVHWSPDGQWLAVEVEATGQDYATYLVPAGGGEPHTVSIDGTWIPARDAAWSPDGSRLAFASDLRGNFDIGLYDLRSGRVAWATEGEGDKEYPDWSPDGRYLAYVHSDGPLTKLAVLDLEANQARMFQVGPAVHYRPRFTRDGAGLVFIFDSPRHPDDLWLLSLETGNLQQLTHSLPPDLHSAPLAVPEQILYPSLDGTPVPALLYRPAQMPGRNSDPGASSGPGLVYVHGGPNWLTQVTWDPVVQHVVSRGWVVLAPNYRGSTGYGRDWQLANRFDLGGGDTEDVVAGAAYLAREGLADPARIAVTGRSYGGYLTMTSLTRYPDRWAAGSAVVPFLNWFTGHANSREDLQHWDLENFGHPERDRDLYYERSPFFFLERVMAPVQLICGAHDPRCPASESIQARDELVSRGKTCELLLYRDEGHSFLKTENRVDAELRRLAFLAGALERDLPPEP